MHGESDRSVATGVSAIWLGQVIKQRGHVDQQCWPMANPNSVTQIGEVMDDPHNPVLYEASRS
jgi:hypothetical protein